jgi:hypothetical protein
MSVGNLLVAIGITVYPRRPSVPGLLHLMAKRQKHLFPELDEIIAALRSDRRQDLVIIFVPSHDKREQPLPDQDQWAHAACNLLGELFNGATAFRALAGVYKAPDGRILQDQPILVESYVEREDLEDVHKLRTLLSFLKRMGRETNQQAVGLVVNHVFHEITRFSQ